MDRFDDLYKEFLNYIAKNFPEYKKYVDTDSKNYIYDFIELNLPFMEEISLRNVDIFRYKYKDTYLIKGLKFKRILEKSNKVEPIWRYLHKLYIVAYSCNLEEIVRKKYNKFNDISRVLELHNAIVENIMLSGYPIIEESSSSDEEEEEELSDDEKEMRDKFKRYKKGENVDEPPSEENIGLGLENMFEGTAIGNLAKELSEEINLDELKDLKIDNPSEILGMFLNPNSDNQNKIKNITDTVFKKLDTKMKDGSLSQEQLFGEAQKMMQNMGGMFGNSTDMLRQVSSMMGQSTQSKKVSKKRMKHRANKNNKKH